MIFFEPESKEVVVDAAVVVVVLVAAVSDAALAKWPRKYGSQRWQGLEVWLLVVEKRLLEITEGLLALLNPIVEARVVVWTSSAKVVRRRQR